MKKLGCLVLLFCVLLAAGCGSSSMKDGFYTAEMSEADHGWQEYLCIMVKDDKIVYAEYNAKDASGYIKAWDNAYMKQMNAGVGTYPNEYTRNYVEQLIKNQGTEEFDAISGASMSAGNFVKLVEAVVKQAKKGDSTTVLVE